MGTAERESIAGGSPRLHLHGISTGRLTALALSLLCAWIFAGCAGTRERAAYSELADAARIIGVHRSAESAAGNQHRAGAADAATTRASLPAIPPQASLDDLLLYAALNNPELEARFYHWQAALERVAQARGLPDLQLTYAYYIQEVETRVGPQRQRLGISQRIPWPDKLNQQTAAALAGAEIAREKLTSAHLDLEARVAEAFHEAAYLVRAQAITVESVALLTDLEGVVRIRYAAGTASHAALISVQLELGRLEERQAALDARRKPLLARLNTALGRVPQARLPWPLPVPWPVPWSPAARESAGPAPTPLPAGDRNMGSHGSASGAGERGGTAVTDASDEQLRAWLAAGNPELRVFDRRLAVAHARQALAGAAYFPDLVLGADWIATDERPLPGLEENGKDAVIARIGFSLPLWFGKHRAAEREAAAHYAEVLAQRRARADQLALELEELLYELRDAERKIELFGHTLIPKAYQGLAVTRQAFAGGEAHFADLIDVQQALLELQLAYARAQATRGQRAARLAALLGREVGSGSIAPPAATEGEQR